jgi:cell wall-associated NlpC family hydrolase
MKDVASLEAAALAWMGTPFCERSAVRGAGVSCHRLAAAIYRDAGWTPALEFPDAPTGWSRAQTRSLIAEWLDGPGTTWFTSVPNLELIEPGDLLGFKIGHAIHHVGIHLPGGRLVSAMQNVGVRIAPNITPVWMRRLRRVWRPNP